MRTVLYEDRRSHSLKTFDDIKEEYMSENKLLSASDEEVSWYIAKYSVCNANHILTICGDAVLNWCNDAFDSIEGSNKVPKVTRDRCIRDIYERRRGYVLKHLLNGSMSTSLDDDWKGLMQKCVKSNWG